MIITVTKELQYTKNNLFYLTNIPPKQQILVREIVLKGLRSILKIVTFIHIITITPLLILYVVRDKIYICNFTNF